MIVKNMLFKGFT